MKKTAFLPSLYARPRLHFSSPCKGKFPGDWPRFSESRVQAEVAREHLSGACQGFSSGSLVADSNNPLDVAELELWGAREAAGPMKPAAEVRAAAVEALKDLRDRIRPDWMNAATSQVYTDAINCIEAGKAIIAQDGGLICTAELEVSDDTLLDLDRPVGEQPHLEAALARFAKRLDKNSTGREARDYLARHHLDGRTRFGGPDERAAERHFQRYGVVGTRYLAKPESDTVQAEAAHCYAIFDPAVVRITAREGQALLSELPGVVAMIGTVKTTLKAVLSGAPMFHADANAADEARRGAASADFLANGSDPRRENPNAPMDVARRALFSQDGKANPQQEAINMLRAEARGRSHDGSHILSAATKKLWQEAARLIELGEVSPPQQDGSVLTAVLEFPVGALVIEGNEPLSEQPEVLAALQRCRPELEPIMGGDRLTGHLAWWYVACHPPGPGGEGKYNPCFDRDEMSRVLREAGIVAMRYSTEPRPSRNQFAGEWELLDHTGRTLAKGERADMLSLRTESYMVFDPSGVKFISRDGVPLAVDDPLVRTVQSDVSAASAGDRYIAGQEGAEHRETGQGIAGLM